MSNFGKSLAAVAVAGGALVGLAAPATADGYFYAYSHSPPASWHHRHHHRPRVVYGPRAVFVAPPPVYDRPAPVVFVPPPPGAPMTVTPTSAPYRTADGRYCREYTSTVYVGGQPQPSYGTACQMPDGSWHILN